jgi:hypothetical protein
MSGGNTKKVVVLKNIRSNFIEEAILILKDNISEADKTSAGNTGNASKSGNKPSKSAIRPAGRQKDFMLLEAENIINEYIRHNDLSDKYTFAGKYNSYAIKKNKVNLYINTALAFSLILLAFIIYKLL